MYKIVSFPDIHLRLTILSFSSISLPLTSPKKQRCMAGRHHNYLCQHLLQANFHAIATSFLILYVWPGISISKESKCMNQCVWIKKAEQVKHMYKKSMRYVCTFRFCVEHHMWRGAHCGGHIQLVQERQSRQRQSQGDRPFMRAVTACLENKVWAVSGAVMLVCSAATQVSEERTGKPEKQSRRRTEHQRASRTKA